MKNIFKTTKRGILVILTLSILLCNTGISVYSISMSEENIATSEENTAVIEETTQELMPMMAQRCCDEDDSYDDYSYYNGQTFNSTADGLNAMGIPFSGSGLYIILLMPMLDIDFNQCGTDFCVFITDKETDRQLTWFKVNRW